MLIRNKPVETIRKRPESQPTSRMVEVITISDSSDSEKDEPSNKKKKTFHQPLNDVRPPVLITNIKKEKNTDTYQFSDGAPFVNCMPSIGKSGKILGFLNLNEYFLLFLIEKIKLERVNDEYLNIRRLKVEPA